MDSDIMGPCARFGWLVLTFELSPTDNNFWFSDQVVQYGVKEC